jgi:hypothetical protein
MEDDQALRAQKRKTHHYMLATVILSFFAIGTIVAVVVVKSESGSSGTNTMANADAVKNAFSVNVGHIPDAFHANMMINHQDAFTADPVASTPYVAPMATESTHVTSFYQDRSKGVKDVIFHTRKWHNSTDEFRIVTDLNNMVQSVESTAAGSCILLPIDANVGLDTNFRAVSAIPSGSITVQGRPCTQYNAVRSDGKSFTYSIDTTTRSVCDIRMGRSVFTMLSFTPNAPRPDYSPACKASFNSVIAWKQSGNGPASLPKFGIARDSSVNQISSNNKFATQSIWNPWDDAKDVFGDVTKWAGGVYDWAKAHYCQLCEPIMDQVIDKGTEIGSDFICDAATEGAAADFCGELAEDAVKAGCQLLDCAKKLCSAISHGKC